MNLRWSLDALYPSFESKEFQEDLQKCEDFIVKIKSWSQKNLIDPSQPVPKMEEYIHMETEFGHLFSRLIHFAELTLSVDAKNEKALEMVEHLEGYLPELAEPTVLFQKWLGSINNFDELIDSSSILKEHQFYLHELYEKSKYLLSEKEEVLIAKMKNTGSNAWSKLQELLSSTLLVDLEMHGETKQLPLSIVRNMAYKKDPEIRKRAYECELQSYNKIADSSAASLNGIKGEVITIADMKGYASPLEMTLLNARMDEDTLHAMLTAMKESLPAFHKYYRRKGELLGHKNGLPFYDMFAPMGDANMEFSYEEAKNFIVKNFGSFSSKLGNFAKNAFENNWIDAEPREGKRGGAFCANLHVIKESRILANFTGSFNDVTTLAHELGHGYHGECLTEESYLNSDYPMPIAETASIFCETIITNAALKEANKEEAFSILENDLMSSGQVIVDIYSRYLFEKELFNRRKKASVSVNELKNIMLHAQKEAYGDGLDPNVLHPYMWVCKPHYYYSEQNYYNFPYAFGLLFAKGLYAEYLSRGEDFVSAYDELLRATGKNKIADVTKMMNIDIHSVDFWRNSLKLIEADIEKFLELSK